MEYEGESSDPEVIEATVPPRVPAGGSDEARPRRISIKKIDKMMRQRQKLWFGRHIAPLYDLIETRTINTVALMLYARLWQLERWLRDLLQLELQAAYGPTWTKRFAAAAKRQSDSTPANDYMASVDDGNPIAYADLSNLGDVLLDDWELVGYAFPPKARWTGALETLLPIRHRIGHCRRAHARDLARFEDALRDLNPRVRKTFASYAEHHFIDESSGILYEHWQRDSPTPHHLANWAKERYDTTIGLRTSRRPWAGAPNVRSGELLHVEFRSHRDPIRIERVIEDLDEIEGINELIHLDVTSPTIVEAVFSRGDEGVLDEAIHMLLESIITAESRIGKRSLKACRRAAELDYRVRFEDYFSCAADMWQADVFRVDRD